MTGFTAQQGHSGKSFRTISTFILFVYPIYTRSIRPLSASPFQSDALDRILDIFSLIAVINTFKLGNRQLE